MQQYSVVDSSRECHRKTRWEGT